MQAIRATLRPATPEAPFQAGLSSRRTQRALLRAAKSQETCVQREIIALRTLTASFWRNCLSS